jgi:hypothetical protein
VQRLDALNLVCEDWDVIFAEVLDLAPDWVAQPLEDVWKGFCAAVLKVAQHYSATRTRRDG